MKNKTTSITISVLLVMSLLALLDPFMYWMPTMYTRVSLLITTILLVIWTGLVMYEQTTDERDVVHRMNAGRVAYLSGVATLTIALLVQSMGYVIDPWIAITLLVMVIAKISARFYSEHNQ